MLTLLSHEPPQNTEAPEDVADLPEPVPLPHRPLNPFAPSGAETQTKQHTMDPKSDRDNRSNQLNSNNDAYWSSRGIDRDDD